MSVSKLVLTIAIGVVLTMSLAAPSKAQIPEEFSNLQILPEDIGQRDLINVMRRFAGSLGVRCNHCHVGENTETLEDHDFASDEKETKKIARVMMQMTDAINNTHMPQIGRTDAKEVSCGTCRSGLTKPTTLRAELLGEYSEKGLDATREFEPELVLCDWIMPGLDGLAFCKNIKSDPDLQSTYITMLSRDPTSEFSADEITIGVPDLDIVPQLQRSLHTIAVKNRNLAGRPLTETGPVDPGKDRTDRRS